MRKQDYKTTLAENLRVTKPRADDVAYHLHLYRGVIPEKAGEPRHIRYISEMLKLCSKMALTAQDAENCGYTDPIFTSAARAAKEYRLAITEAELDLLDNASCGGEE